MNPIFDEKYELQVVTGNVDCITTDHFTLATDEKQTIEVQTMDHFNVASSQSITAVWIQDRESAVEPKLIFLYNKDTNSKEYMLPPELQKKRFKLSNQSIIQLVVNILGGLLLLGLISIVINILVPGTIYNECANLVYVIIFRLLQLLITIALLVTFVRKSIKSHEQSNEGYFWITKTLDSFIGINEPPKKQDLQQFRSQVISRYLGLIQWSLGFAKKFLKPVELPKQTIVTNSFWVAFAVGMAHVSLIATQFAIALFPLILVLSPLWLPVYGIVYGITKLPDIVNSFSVCFPR